MPAYDAARYHSAKPSFCAWLLKQTGRTDEVGFLAKAVAVDRSFPREGSAGIVSRHLNRHQADGDMHLALETAELDYHCH